MTIWTDRWLPKPTNFQIISTPCLLPSDSKVSNLMHLKIGEWKTSLLKQIFLPDNVNTILSILLGSFKLRDRLIWAYTPRGIFTMNSAYKLALLMTQSLATAKSSDEDTYRLFWCTIWRLRAPNKVKTFTWKVCCNILPTKANLCHRHVLNDSTYEAYNLA